VIPAVRESVGAALDSYLWTVRDYQRRLVRRAQWLFGLQIATVVALLLLLTRGW
jgi:hypothetical protein